MNGRDDQVPLLSANDILGGNLLGRLNMNLRETKGWTYGVRSVVTQPLGQVAFRVQAPVQADRTGDAIAEIRKEMSSFLSGNGVTAAELEWSTNGSARELPGSFETSSDVLGGLVKIVTRERPDDYYETLGQRYGTLTASELDAAARAQLGKGDLLYVVVGDAAKVRPQLDALGLPVEIRTMPGQ